MQLATCLELLDRLGSEIRDLHAQNEKLQKEHYALNSALVPRVASWNGGPRAVQARNYLSVVDIDIAGLAGKAQKNKSGLGCDGTQSMYSIATEGNVSAMSRGDAECVLRHGNTLKQSLQSSPRLQDVCKMDDTWICIGRLLSEIGAEGGNSPTVDAVLRGDTVSSLSMSPSGDRSACCALRPNSPFRYAWDAFGFTFATIDFLMFPLLVYQMYGLPGPGLPVLVYSHVSNVYWVCLIVVSFFTGFNTPEGYFEMRLSMTARNYIRTWFAFDVCVILPSVLELCIILFAPGETRDRVARVTRMHVFACFARALRFRHIFALLQTFLECLNSEHAVIVMEFLRRVALILILYHYLACIWFAIGVSSKNSWIKAFEDDIGRKFCDTLEAYVVCLHWSLVHLGIGEIGIEPVNTVERIFNCFVIVISLMFVSAILSGFTTTTDRLRYLDMQRRDQNLKLRRYFRHHSISPGLARRVWHWRRKLQPYCKAREVEQDVVLLASLPRHLHSEVRREAFEPYLLTHPVFRQMSQVGGESVTQICSTAVDESVLQGVEDFLPQDAPLTTAIFTLGGSLKQKTDDEGDSTLTIPGQWACEIALWATNLRNGGCLFAAPSGCELIIVRASDFQRICMLNYINLGFVAVYAKLAVEHFGKTNRLHQAAVFQTSDLDLSREWVAVAMSMNHKDDPRGS